ncbi:MAG: hypothetical protein K2M04_02530, partial [Muribaculaceae bacterium]|nr:hypothetical protein [Muribaculaceae bacterium]
EIMTVFGMSPSDPPERLKMIGALKTYIKDAILDGVIPNDHDAAFSLMLSRASQLGLDPVQSSPQA